MNASADDNPERLLSAALRAQATGGRGTVQPAPPPTAPARRLPVMPVLLFAILLGLVAGAIVGGLTLL
jgi:hypothetical protein